jgi:hypothetical protein
MNLTKWNSARFWPILANIVQMSSSAEAENWYAAEAGPAGLFPTSSSLGCSVIDITYLNTPQ